MLKIPSLALSRVILNTLTPFPRDNAAFPYRVTRVRPLRQERDLCGLRPTAAARRLWT
jgi:hypothetical protein